MCNLYAVTKGQQAIRELMRAMFDRTGKLPSLPGIFPDYSPDRPEHGGQLGAVNGEVGDAFAGVRVEGPQQRPRRDERPQHRLAALAPVAGT
jgi:hypothetical protein